MFIVCFFTCYSAEIPETDTNEKHGKLKYPVLSNNDTVIVVYLYWI